MASDIVAHVSPGDSLSTIVPAPRLRGAVPLPGDKSISHRYAILAALADGESTLHRYAPGRDCHATLACLAALGAGVDARPDGVVHIVGRGLGQLTEPAAPLDAGNSGSTMRMLAGVLAGHPFRSILDGDRSLRQRPMRRVADPLARMGARIETTGGHAPLTIEGGRLHGITFEPPVPSAQVKSAVLLAGLHAEGDTTVAERTPTRDHTERALATFGAPARIDADGITVGGGQRLAPRRDLLIPGDASSAAFWAVAAAVFPGSEVELLEVGLNPGRVAFLDVLRAAGARVTVEPAAGRSEEPVGRVVVGAGTLSPVRIEPADVPPLIDELPVLALLGVFGAGFRVDGAAELRAKEADRIAALAAGLRALGASVEEWADGFAVAPSRLRGGTTDAAGDHRLAMTFALAALGADGPSMLRGAEAVAVSYPGFFDDLRRLTDAAS